MPHLRKRGDEFVAAHEYSAGAFYVPDDVFHEWFRLATAAYPYRPTNRHGLPLRPMPGGIYNGDPVEPGIFVDWQADVVRLFCFNERRTAVAEQPTHRNLAERFGPFQHNLHPYRAADCQARRVDRGQARGGQARDPLAADYRRWSNRRWSPQGAAAAVAADPHGRYRHFGIEIESFGSDPHRHEITRQARLAGLTIHERWHTHTSDPHLRGWQGLRDGSVPGGTEIVSDVLVGDNAAHDEVQSMLRIIRNNGGRAQAGQGMHTNHDVRDFTRQDKVRLVGNLRVLAPLLSQFVAPSRLTEYYARPLSTHEWDDVAACAVAGRACRVERYRHFNFQHMHRTDGAARIEWRLLGHTLNGRKVRTWIRVGQAVMQATKDGVVFDQGTTVASMLATLRQHGLTTWAAEQFATRCGVALPLAA